jgi:hypothetical protein
MSNPTLTPDEQSFIDSVRYALAAHEQRFIDIIDRLTGEIAAAPIDELLFILNSLPEFQVYNSLTNDRFLEVTTLFANDLDRLGELKAALQRLADLRSRIAAAAPAPDESEAER